MHELAFEAALGEAFAAARRPSELREIGEASENPAFAALVGKRRDQVAFETVSALRWDLEWFERPGLRYYLPCFLLGALGDPEVADGVVSYLARASSDRGALWPSEQRAVRDVLIELRGRGVEAAGEALAGYWASPPIAALDETRERLARRILCDLPDALDGAEGPAGAPGPRPRELERLGAYDLAQLGADAIKRGLPALLLAALETSTTAILKILSPSETPNPALLAQLTRELSADQLALVHEVAAYRRGREAPSSVEEPHVR